MIATYHSPKRAKTGLDYARDIIITIKDTIMTGIIELGLIIIVVLAFAMSRPAAQLDRR